MAPEITIFISCYNERESIVPTLETVCMALSHSPLSWEVLVIDDRSSDDSVAMIESFTRAHPNLPVRTHFHETNKGIGWTVFEAARLAQGRCFWYVAGDNPVPPDTCATLISYVGKADIIIPNITDFVGRSWFRECVSRLYALLVRIVSGCPVRYYNGSSIYRREDFIAFAERNAGFAYSAEVIVTLINRGCSYIEVPVHYHERTTGKSTAINAKNFGDVARFFGRQLKRRFG